MWWAVVAFGVGIVLVQALVRSIRKQKLLKRYGDEEVVRRILAKHIWQGETEEMLVDSLGRPLRVEDRVLKTKRKQIWKYHQTRRGAFGTQVTIENGVVVGWNIK